jgi:hypothetical protein
MYVTPNLLADVREQVEDLRLERDVKRREGLVEDDDAWLRDERPSDRHPLPLSPREPSRARAQVALVESHQARHLGEPVRTPRARALGLVQSEQLEQAVPDVLPGIERREGILEHDLQLARAASPLVGTAHRRAAITTAGSRPHRRASSARGSSRTARAASLLARAASHHGTRDRTSAREQDHRLRAS